MSASHKLCLTVLCLCSAGAFAQNSSLGAVVLHGKGGSPTRLVAPLVEQLQAAGVHVEAPDMPWSGQRNYDVTTEVGHQELAAALARLEKAGAKHRFILGHSMGGVFAFNAGSRHAVAGIVAIAPGGSSDAKTTREKLGATLAEAESLVKAGQGDVTTKLYDYEGSRGLYPVQAKPAAYVSWFDPEGAMNVDKSLRQIPASLPVLYVSPTDDYPGLRAGAAARFHLLPKHPLTQFAEPVADHKSVPGVATPLILTWMQRVAK